MAQQSDDNAPEGGPSGLLNWLNQVKTKNIVLALLSLAVFIIGGVSTLWSGAGSAIEFLSDIGVDEGHEQRRLLEGLQPGLPIDAFVSELGEPISRWQPDDSSLTETIWAGEEYYVQAIADEIGTVQMYAVTSCSRTFNVFGLNESALIEFDMDPWEWFFSGATSESYAFDLQPAANPSLYRETYVGWNDSCPLELAQDCESLPDPFSLSASNGRVEIPNAVAIDAARSCILPNTRAQTAPRIDELPLLSDCSGSGSARRCFTIGPRRTVVRTLPGPGGQP